MALRRKLSNATSKSIFTQTAMKTNAKNVMPVLMQNGYRM